MKLSVLMVVVGLLGLGAGMVSAAVNKNQLHWAWSGVIPMLMALMWTELMRSHKDKLLLITGLSDLLYNGTWFLGMILMGIPTTWTQKLGILLLVVGVYLIG
jgi:hypothetical protein